MVALRKDIYQHPDYRQQAIDLIQYVSQQAHIVTFPIEFLGLLDNQHEAAILLNQILYWSSRTSNPDGWFYKTYDQWESELGLTRYKIQRALRGDSRSSIQRRTLSDIGVETCVRKAPDGNPTVHYRIEMTVFMGYLEAYLEGRLNDEFVPNCYIVTEPSATESDNETEQCDTSSLYIDSQSEDYQSESNTDDERLISIFSSYEKSFGQLQKLSNDKQAVLLNEYDRLGHTATINILERCIQYGKSWHYVLTALQNERTEESSKVTEPVYTTDEEPMTEEELATAFAGLRILQKKNPIPEGVVCEPTDSINQAWEQRTGNSETVAKLWQMCVNQLELQLDTNTVHCCLFELELMDFDKAASKFTFISESRYAVDYAIRIHRNFERILSDVFGITATIRVMSKYDWLVENNLIPQTE